RAAAECQQAREIDLVITGADAAGGVVRDLESVAAARTEVGGAGGQGRALGDRIAWVDGSPSRGNRPGDAGAAQRAVRVDGDRTGGLRAIDQQGAGVDGSRAGVGVV